MFAIIGITGQVGSAIARHLLAAEQNVRAVVRDAAKGEYWAQQGCEVAVADIHDIAALVHAFSGVDGVFVMLPPNFDPSVDFSEVKQRISALCTALEIANPPKVVCLSTVGAQATQPNLLQQLGLFEASLGELSMPVTFLRAAWFMENFIWSVAAAINDGVFHSYLQPADQGFPMVAVADIGRVAAQQLQQSWQGKQIIELAGPALVSPQDIATCFSHLLGQDVRLELVDPNLWEAQFRAQGMQNPTPRIQMLTGFNQGWICFESEPQRGRVGLDTVLRELISRTQPIEQA